MTPYRCIAFFDFDGTLAQGDSLWPFLLAVSGWPRCVSALLCGAWSYLTAPRGIDKRTIIKARLLEQILRGKTLEDIKPAIERMRTWPRWMETVEALKKHHAEGCHIVIATGSLGLYVKAMLGTVPYDAILATEMETVEGVLTGRMSLGNCVRDRKAARVAAYLSEQGPFGDSWAYGNAPHDLPMMEHVHHRVIV